MSRPRRAAGLLLVLLAVLVGAPDPAYSHAELVSMTPADGSSVDAMPRALQLRFSEGVTAPAAVVVVGPSGRELSEGDPATLGRRLTQRLTGTTDGAGVYAVRFQVMSQDGHLVYGAATFTVSGDGPARSAALRDDLRGSTRPAVLLLALALLALLGVTGAGVGRLARDHTGD